MKSAPAHPKKHKPVTIVKTAVKGVSQSGKQTNTEQKPNADVAARPKKAETKPADELPKAAPARPAAKASKSTAPRSVEPSPTKPAPSSKQAAAPNDRAKSAVNSKSTPAQPAAKAPKTASIKSVKAKATPEQTKPAKTAALTPIPKTAKARPAASNPKATTARSAAASPKSKAAPAVQGKQSAKSKKRTVAPPADPVRVAPEVVLSTGRMWRMASGYSVAYVTNAEVACEMLGTNRKNLDRQAMAYYTDRKGRTFAWQVSFRTDRWDEMARRLG